MIDQNPIPNVSRADRREREKDTTITRIPRDPEDPQKFQALVGQDKQKKEEEVKKREEPVVASPSIFDISSQKARTRAHTPVREGSGKDAEAMKSTFQPVEGKVAKGQKGPSSEEGSTRRVKSDKGSGSSTTSSLSSKADAAEEDSLIAMEPVDEKQDSDEHSSDKETSSPPKDITIQPMVADVVIPKDAALPTPPIAPVVHAIESVAKPQAVPMTRDLQEVIDHVVKSISLLSASNQTDLLVTLRNPPILSGSELVLSSFGTAKGEFNVAFYNLTQASQQFLQQIHAQTGIKQALEQKGYIMHMFIASAQPYQPIVATDTDNRTDQRRFHDEGQGQDERKQRERDA